MSKKQKVLVLNKGNGVKYEAEGTVWEYEGISLVTVKDGSFYRVYEVSTGEPISEQYATKTVASAKVNAIAKIDQYGIEKCKEKIKQTLERQVAWESPTHAKAEWKKYTQ